MKLFFTPNEEERMTLSVSDGGIQKFISECRLSLYSCDHAEQGSILLTTSEMSLNMIS